VTRIELDLTSKVPIYIQIRDHLRLMIMTGEFAAGKQMPPVRDLATDLLINPNTVSKAYQDLEREGHIYTKRGMGTFVSERPAGITKGLEKNLVGELSREYVARLLEMGLTADEIRARVNEILEKS